MSEKKDIKNKFKVEGILPPKTLSDEKFIQKETGILPPKHFKKNDKKK